jgi:hypothetical protein
MRCDNRLHNRRLRNPVSNSKITAIAPVDPIEAPIVVEEVNYITLPGSRLAREATDESMCKRTQPEPRPAQRFFNP